MRWSLLGFLSMALCMRAALAGEPLDPARVPSLLAALKNVTALEFCGERTPIEHQEVRERLEKELLLSLWDRPQVILWLKRSRRYLPHIEQTLRDHGMPDDLKYIAIAESALLPHAGSNRGAMGFWQFTRYTARAYGLVVNERIDARRNIFAATLAAIRYLRKLYTTFGSWTLAAAAYNMGEDGLMGEILHQGTRDYYHLYLPLETQRYVFKILSAKLILSAPKKYGFHLDAEDYYPPLRFDRVQVSCPQDTPIRIVAKAAKTTFKMIKDLNPEIRGHHLAEGNHQLLVPPGASKGFKRRYLTLLKRWEAERQKQIYIVKAGDSLSSIAEHFNIPLRAILIWNRLNLRQPIHPGDQLILHPKTPQPETNHDRMPENADSNN